MNKLKQYFTNGRRLGDDWWFLIKMAVQGHLLTDEKYQRFIHGLMQVSCCESCQTLVRHGFPDTEQVL